MKFFIAFICTFSSLFILAQNDTARVFNLSFEFRPRAEYRDGYAQLPNDSSKAAFFVSNRARLKLDYEQKKFKLHCSLQDVRVWGEGGTSEPAGNFGVFEVYVEPFFTKEWSIRIGRQGIELDNGRLFSLADWSQSSRAHEGINLRYNGKRLRSEIMSFYSQSHEQIFGTSYSYGPEIYKLLNIHYLTFKLSDKFKLTTLNSVDGFESAFSNNTLYVRATSGGRIDFKHKRFSATFSGYYQYGKSSYGQDISAFYYQPEVSLSFDNIKARLGMEYASGRNPLGPFKQTPSFSTLYGVAFKFMGNMNYFTRLSTDTHNKGLINPYLFLSFRISSKINLLSEAHMFLTAQSIYVSTQSHGPSYLGFENDFKIHYELNELISMKAAVSIMFATENMEIFKGGNSGRVPVYSYFMVTFTPQLYNSIKKYQN